jgi:hypothetical protein
LRATIIDDRWETAVPQIWLSYEELAVLMNCDPASARNAAAGFRLDRRRSRDGQTRTKLTPPLAEAFFDKVWRQRLEHEIAACAGDLRAMRERMARQSAAVTEIQLPLAG